MIFDRTEADVKSAKRIIEEKVKKFIELTDADINVLERGTLTSVGLNRIESKQSELKDALAEIGYYIQGALFGKTWNETMIFNILEMERICNNTEILRNAFYVYKDTPPVPKNVAKYHYGNINSIERNLFDLEKMISDVEQNYRICGATRCGE